MKKRHEYKLYVYEQLYRYPKTIEEAEANRNPKRVDIDRIKIVGRNIDDSLETAREYVVKKLGRIIRSCSIGPQGIHVVVYNRNERNSDVSVSLKTGRVK